MQIDGPTGDSASNGCVENAIKRVGGLAKLLKSDLEAREGLHVGPERLVFEWAGGIVSSYVEVWDIGNAAVQIIRGYKAHRTLPRFVEEALHHRAKSSSHSKADIEGNYQENEVAFCRGAHRNHTREGRTAQTGVRKVGE